MVPRGKLNRLSRQGNISELILLWTQDLFFHIYLTKADFAKLAAKANS